MIGIAGRVGMFSYAEPRQRTAGRRSWPRQALMVGATLAAAVVSYSLSLKVSNERSAVDKLVTENRNLEDEIRTMQAELRVRMRMPQLQRWNDEVLGMTPIVADQLLTNPLHLTAYGRELPGEGATLAIIPAVPNTAAQQPARPHLVSAPARPADTARLVQAPAAPAAPVARVTLAKFETPTVTPASRAQVPPLEARPEPRAERVVTAQAAARPAPAGIDPMLIAAIDEAARREASASGPANLLTQVKLDDHVSGYTRSR